jgi:hypothetical protein
MHPVEFGTDSLTRMSTGVNHETQFILEVCIWGHWISAVKWDREVNTRPLCHKITDQHLYPNSSEKMRNHLAEDMLNEDFLYLMEAFQSDLNDGSSFFMLCEKS